MSDEWYREAFGALYVELYAHRDEQEARDTVDLLTSLPGVATGCRVLDAPCGAGRHSCEFARRGYRVEGLDLSVDLLKMARENCGDGAGVTQADLRRLPVASSRYDVVANLFSSVGYFEAETENLRVIGELARVCREGGLVVIDFMNSAQVRATLKPETERTTEAGHHVHDWRRIAGEPPRVEKRTRVRLADGRMREMHESVRLFEPGELRAAMEGAGLAVEQQFGDYRGGTWAVESPRVILVGRKR